MTLIKSYSYGFFLMKSPSSPEDEPGLYQNVSPAASLINIATSFGWLRYGQCPESSNSTISISALFTICQTYLRGIDLSFQTQNIRRRDVAPGFVSQWRHHSTKRATSAHFRQQHGPVLGTIGSTYLREFHAANDPNILPLSSRSISL
jgi:hypothetical protein